MASLHFLRPFCLKKIQILALDFQFETYCHYSNVLLAFPRRVHNMSEMRWVDDENRSNIAGGIQENNDSRVRVNFEGEAVLINQVHIEDDSVVGVV